MRIHIQRLILLIVAAGLGGCGGDKTLSILDPWARPGSVGSNSAIYFTVDNPNDQEDTLLSASCDAASQVEIHMSTMGEDETMSMHHQPGVEVPGRSQVEFKPGGLHIMLVNLQRNLEEGDSLEFALNFQKAGEIRLEVPIEQR